mgnify:FL=1
MKLKSSPDVSVLLVTRYLIVGGLIGIGYYGISWVLLTQCELSLALSATIAFLATSPLAYLCHRIVTFKTSKSLSQVIRFGCSACLLLGFSYLIEILFGNVLGQHILISLTWVTSAVINFFLYTIFVFRN